MYISTWHQLKCDHCYTINWIDVGDISDLTQFDPEAVKCWKCGKSFWISEGEEDPPDPELCDEGIKSPS